MNFSFWGFVKDNVYNPSFPVDLQRLRDRTVKTTDLVDVTSLKNCGANESVVYRITKDSRIEDF
jgi:hypothetical protein